MRRNSLYIISSLLFACVLFIYATSINYQNNTNARQTKTETYTNTVVNVPIDIQYDSEQYFISGFSSEVTVFLTGSNRVALASEMQESTRKFKVTVIFCGVATAVKPLGRFSMVKGTSIVPSVACVKSAVTLNLRVLSCISLAMSRSIFSIRA